MNVILTAVIVLGAVGLIAAVVLFFVSKKFAVKEDPRIALVNEVLPGANCGGCGFPGCGGMASACVKAADNGSLEGLNCPVGGSAVMSQVASILGMEATASDPKVAVVRCNGSCENRPRIAEYDGLKTCRAVHACGAGETGCGNGCLGCGDCVAACKFDAIHINPETGIPEVDEEKCVACGACVGGLCEPGQGSRSHESLQGVVYRLREVCEGVQVRRYRPPGQCVVHRRREVQGMPCMYEGLSS